MTIRFRAEEIEKDLTRENINEVYFKSISAQIYNDKDNEYKGCCYVVPSPTDNCQVFALRGVQSILAYYPQEYVVELIKESSKLVYNKRLVMLDINKRHYEMFIEKFPKAKFRLRAHYKNTTYNDMVLMLLDTRSL